MIKGDIHIGSRKTLKTNCGKSVKRRWWVETTHTETGKIAGLGVYRVVKPQGATCKKCIRREKA